MTCAPEHGKVLFDRPHRLRIGGSRASRWCSQHAGTTQDELGRTADLYREGLSLSWDIGLTPLVQSVLEGFACLAGARGDVTRAVWLWGAAQTLHEAKGIPRDDDILAEADARISVVRSGMGEEAWKQAWRKGRAMTLDEAVSYASEENTNR